MALSPAQSELLDLVVEALVRRALAMESAEEAGESTATDPDEPGMRQGEPCSAG